MRARLKDYSSHEHRGNHGNGDDVTASCGTTETMATAMTSQRRADSLPEYKRTKEKHIKQTQFLHVINSVDNRCTNADAIYLGYLQNYAGGGCLKMATPLFWCC